MKKVLFSLMTVAILTGGASCANPFVKDETINDYPTDTSSSSDTAKKATTPAAETPAAPATTPVSTQPTTQPVTEPESLPTTLTLSTAEAQGNGMVKIEFTVPEELAKSAVGYRLMMSKDPNPTISNSTDWYELGPAHRSKMWKVNAIGQRYVKICAITNNACTAVSQVLPVEVK